MRPSTAKPGRTADDVYGRPAHAPDEVVPMTAASSSRASSSRRFPISTGWLKNPFRGLLSLLALFTPVAGTTCPAGEAPERSTMQRSADAHVVFRHYL